VLSIFKKFQNIVGMFVANIAHLRHVNAN